MDVSNMATIASFLFKTPSLLKFRMWEKLKNKRS